MKGESRALLRALLAHHERVRRPPGSVVYDVDARTITYGQLCAAANVPWLTRHPGPFLLEIAEWCSQNGHPPLNALAVNGDTKRPGDEYDGAGGFHLLDWPKEVELCLTCDQYPTPSQV